MEDDPGVEIPLKAMLQAIIERYPPDAAAQMMNQHDENELIAHSRHAAEAGCERCADLIARFDAGEDGWTIDELVSHMSLEDDLQKREET
jgi:hypothetical protein